MNSRAFLRIVAALTVGWILFLLCEEVSRGFRRHTSHSAKLFQSPFDSIAACRHSDRLEDSCVVFSDDMIDHDDSSDNYNVDDRKPFLFSSTNGATGSTAAGHQQRQRRRHCVVALWRASQESCHIPKQSHFYVDHSSSSSKSSTRGKRKEVNAATQHRRVPSTICPCEYKRTIMSRYTTILARLKDASEVHAAASEDHHHHRHLSIASIVALTLTPTKTTPTPGGSSQSRLMNLESRTTPWYLVDAASSEYSLLTCSRGEASVFEPLFADMMEAVTSLNVSAAREAVELAHQRQQQQQQQPSRNASNDDGLSLKGVRILLVPSARGESISTQLSGASLRDHQSKRNPVRVVFNRSSSSKPPPWSCTALRQHPNAVPADISTSSGADAIMFEHTAVYYAFERYANVAGHALELLVNGIGQYSKEGLSTKRIPWLVPCSDDWQRIGDDGDQHVVGSSGGDNGPFAQLLQHETTSSPRRRTTAAQSPPPLMWTQFFLEFNEILNFPMYPIDFHSNIDIRGSDFTPLMFDTIHFASPYLAWNSWCLRKIVFDVMWAGVLREAAFRHWDASAAREYEEKYMKHYPHHNNVLLRRSLASQLLTHGHNNMSKHNSSADRIMVPETNPHSHHHNASSMLFSHAAAPQETNTTVHWAPNRRIAFLKVTTTTTSGASTTAFATPHRSYPYSLRFEKLLLQHSILSLSPTLPILQRMWHVNHAEMIVTTWGSAFASVVNLLFERRHTRLHVSNANTTSHHRPQLDDEQQHLDLNRMGEDLEGNKRGIPSQQPEETSNALRILVLVHPEYCHEAYRQFKTTKGFLCGVKRLPKSRRSKIVKKIVHGRIALRDGSLNDYYGGKHFCVMYVLTHSLRFVTHRELDFHCATLTAP